MDVGTQLREARHRRGLTLDDIAASTKVSRQTLHCIEHNRFSWLPGGILTRGYLRAYAAEVGLDPEPIVSDYHVQSFGDSGEELPIVRPPPVERETHPGRVLLFEVLAIVVAAAVYQAYGRPAESRAVIELTEADTLQARPELVSLEPAVLHGASVANENDSGVRIEMRPTGPCWVSATADDQVLIHRLLQSGDRAVATANEEMVLRVGDPATFLYWLNGAPGRQLGPAGEAVTVQITVDNYHLFLNASAVETSGSLSSTT